MRPPISLERVQWGGEGVVHYRAKEGHDGRAMPAGDTAEAFDPADFLARVIMHIPDPHRHLVGYYGWHSNVSRGQRRRALEDQPSANVDRAPSLMLEEAQARSPEARALRRSWAEMIKRVYEINPLVCPECGSEMKIIAFIIDHSVVDKILRHLKRREEEGRGRGPPGRSELQAVL
jgi:hypothetical protein